MTYQPCFTNLAAVLRNARTLGGIADLIDEAIDEHIYDVENGDDPPDKDCPYVQAVEHLRALATALTALDGSLASEEEVAAAVEAHCDSSNDVEVDSPGAALVSHADDGYWVSAWVWVEKGLTE